MRILLIGATGTIGRPIAGLLGARHEIVGATRSDTNLAVDITKPDAVRSFLERVGTVDAIVCAAGGARFAPLEKLSDDDFSFSLGNKLMGQVNVIRHGLAHVRDRGSITVTSGVLAWHPMPGSAAISVVNAGLEAFVGAAALEAQRGIRINVVSPPWVTETLQQMKWDLPGGKPAEAVARMYQKAVDGGATGHVIRFGRNDEIESVPLSSR
jgi:NAD(P)-dependent dehydrogenase (short-subunit alcohol dehydrogenase family)